jgi:hypothetical protein
MQDDWKDLHEAIKLETCQMLSTKEALVSVLSGIAAFGSLHLRMCPCLKSYPRLAIWLHRQAIGLTC